MKRWTIALLITLLALGLSSGCSGSTTSGGDSGGQAAKPDAGGEDAPEITTAEELKEALAADHSSADWYGDLVDITAETRLGTPVLVLHVGWGMDDTDWEAKNNKLTAMSEAIGEYNSPIAFNLLVKDADGTVTRGSSTGSSDGLPMDQALDLPAAPATVDEVSAWLETVYGPGGLVTLGAEEIWYDSITSIAMEDVGSGPQMTVATTLGRDQGEELFCLEAALHTTGSPLLTSWAIRGAEGFYMAIGGGANEPGAAGLFYLPEE
jgi:hypothetical protein